MKKEIPWNLIIQKLKHDITAEEEDHEQDLQDYLNDIARMKAYILKK